MGSTVTVVVIGLAAVLACAVFALGLRAPPPPRPAASRLTAARRRSAL